MKETDLARAIITWLQDYQWEVYQEVQIFTQSDVCDIIAIQNNRIWAIECKTSLSIEVMAQAKAWQDFCHYVSVAVPIARTSKGRQFANLIMGHYGIGCLQVAYGDHVTEKIPTKLNRHATQYYERIRNAIRPEHKYWAEAGNNKCNHYTPFQDTCSQIRHEVNKVPGLSARELIDKIKHHYSSNTSARGNILVWAQKGIIKGVEVKQVGKYYKFYPKVEQSEDKLICKPWLESKERK